MGSAIKRYNLKIAWYCILVNRGGGLKKVLKFVVHRHEARHLHFDLRLEHKGVLKSWAVPKGMPEASGVKRLAVEVEDHDIDYATFEGTIPEGYGAGKVEIWDAGTFIDEEWGNDKITVRFNGRRLLGRYSIIRFMEKNWLVIKLKESG